MIWVIVETPSGDRVGGGPVEIRDFDTTRKLDMAGTWRATAIGSDRRALATLDVNNVVRIWRETAGNPAEEVAAGIITTRRYTDVASGYGLIVDGPDLLDELRRKNTLVGRNYSQVTLNTAVQGLIGLVPGWTATVDSGVASTLVDAGFDGYNVLKALVELAHRYDCHLRQSGTPGQRQIEISQLTTATLHTIRNAPTTAGDFGGVGVVVRMAEDQITTTGDNYYNVLLPLGKGEGEAALTLASSTRTAPYPIQTITGPDLRTLYYISPTTYPSGGHANFLTDPEARVNVAQMRDIGPLSNSMADVRNAANALYDEAAEKLERAAVIQRCYDVTLTGVADVVRAGDRARALYHADTPGDGGGPYLSVDGTFIVLEASESVTVDNHVVTLKISNVDRHPVGAKEILLDAINKLELHSLRPNIVQGAPTAYVYQREIAPGLNAEVPVEFTDSTLEVNRVRMRLKTSPLRTTAVDEIDIPAHRHRIATLGTTGGTFTDTRVTMDGGGGSFSNIGGGNINFEIPAIFSSGQNVAYTSETEPNLTSDIAFEIHDDDTYPREITVHLNNTDITNRLFSQARLASFTRASNTAPGGLVVEWHVLAGEISSSSGGYWSVPGNNGQSYVLTGSGTQPGSVFVPRLSGGTDPYEINSAHWQDSGGARRPQFCDSDHPFDDFSAFTTDYSGKSFYTVIDGTVYEFEIDDATIPFGNCIRWTGGNGVDRPAALTEGTYLGWVLADSGESSTAEDYLTLTRDADAVNEVGDPGVLADLIMAAGLQRQHEIEIRCGAGRGRVEVTIERWETTQSILRRS